MMPYTGTNAPDISYTQNRELSWLKFNERVLAMANDMTVPTLERMKFVSIFTSNLDEFFMIRVGSLYDISLVDNVRIDNKSGMTVSEQLRAIFKSVPPLYQKKDAAFGMVEQNLREAGIYRVDFKELDEEGRKFIGHYFAAQILPVLSPQIVDSHHPFPHIENKSLNIAIILKSKEETRFAIIPVPRMLPRLIFLGGGGIRYMLVEDIILKYADEIFDMYTVRQKAVISVTRNADINPDDKSYDLEDDDFSQYMKKILKKRSRLAAVRLEVAEGKNSEIVEYLLPKLKLEKWQVFESSSPLDISYVYAIEDHLPEAIRREVTYKPYTPQPPAGIMASKRIIRQVQKSDLLLHYPYESMEPLLRLIREAAADPGVLSIRITLYRLDKKSKLGEYLIEAAEKGKEVTIIMELRARFDEQNNIEWADRFTEAGCKVLYGFPEYKIHSKICLITRRDKNRIQYITQIGTGNYNEKTAKLYSDLSLVTASDAIGNDANTFFKNMLIANLRGNYRMLLVAPAHLKSCIMSMIEGEIEKAEKGLPCGIIMKMNSITDRDIIDELSRASCAGVRVQLIVRGICCIVPGIAGKTENLTVMSIIGRYLEHSRIYCFGVGDGQRMYISSADMMTRNTERRVEIACPIYDKKIMSRIYGILTLELNGATKAWELLPDGSYELKKTDGEAENSQEQFMEQAIRGSAPEIPQPGRSLLSIFRKAAHIFDL